ncbi:MAG TPA: prepilin peptidase [Terracidiphilus sp.]|jgi:leader peptidase (prepilin peptidase)/N-methyltransferase|nr:prepilin peptidase [Terracidiphilus sp.]
MLRILATIFAALIGLAFGSFLNVCLSRWPQGESIVHPRSHCRACGRTLTWWENIPVVSWLALRGRCRTCGTWISFRYPLVEVSVAAVWAILVWNSADLLAIGTEYAPYWLTDVAIGCSLGFLWLLVALAVLDFEHLWLPDFLTLPGIALGILVRSVMELAANHYIEPQIARKFLWNILGILAAAAIVLAIRWLYWLIRHREGLGLGDAKLLALLAAWLGLPMALLSLFLGVVVAGALTALALLLAKPRRAPGSWAAAKLPLGTFLCIGGIVSALWGQQILSAYLRWAGF